METLLLRVSAAHPPIVSHAFSTACCPSSGYSLQVREIRKKRNRSKNYGRWWIRQERIGYNVLIKKKSQNTKSQWLKITKVDFLLTIHDLLGQDGGSACIIQLHSGIQVEGTATV